MRSIKMTVLALCATAAMGVTAASAMDVSASNCIAMASQVKAALASNPQSSNYDAAVKESHYGHDFCNSSFYKVGIDHYTQALKLIGETAS